ncbi:MAG: single-stranded-DNA-specific exonuclease RecJ, partial [Clostridia bacterium]|nr:single-stranded-DNA-specific exonuclease RecJ [Clostridia bacterium]
MEKVSQVSNKFNISPLIASVILNRGITSDEEIGHYISKDDSQFFDPFLMTDMQKAVDFIKQAILKNITIAVYGDYDV